MNDKEKNEERTMLLGEKMSSIKKVFIIHIYSPDIYMLILEEQNKYICSKW